MFLLSLAGLAALAATDPTPALKPVRINFAAVVGARPFGCDQSYPGIGSSHSTISPLDFRFFVSDLALIDRAGNAVPVEISPDEIWQREGVALLDFEDGTGTCTNGSPETRTAIEGLAPAGDYQGIRFTLGIPFELNHRNPVEQGSPFNVTSMFWVWRAGYKFLRLDVKADGPLERLFVHLGSTGCVAKEAGPAHPAMRCENGNRSVITLTGFDPAKDVVVADVAELLAGSDLTVNQPKSAMGCMSAPDDLDCAPMFDRLGLPFGDHPSVGQRFFRVGRAAGAADAGRR
ncbi:MAG: metallo-mystery pair system four-Cys motif protein [Gemmatimonadales bacterium]